MQSAPQLTPQQEKIAEHKDGPLIVLAGAGSGKTATLVARTGRLIDKGVYPRNILSLTFSRKAATEIKKRLADQYGMNGEDVRVDTFHGMGYRFMQDYKDLFGLTPDQNWAILNENDQRRLMNEVSKEIAEAANIEFKELRKELKEGANLWSLMKQDCRCPGNVSDALIELDKMRAAKNGTSPNAEQVSLKERIVAQSLIKYEEEKRANGYLDFDDLLLLPARAMVKHPKIAEGLSFQHTHIMIDESQDTNLVQYLMMRQIGQHHNNVVMVGDDDQSIYRWRGAKVANLRRFIKDFEAPVARLEQNFRSHANIVNSASSLIQNNQKRLPKNPFSATETGEKPSVEVSDTDRSMALNMVDRVKTMHEQGTPLNDIAILYRTNRMTTVLEPAFKQAGIPYSVVGGMSFYERAEIQAVCACARIVWKNDDWQALKSLQPYIDGLGKKGMADTIERLKNDDMNILSFMLHEAPQQYGKGGIRLQEFIQGVFQNSIIDSVDLDQSQIAARLIQWMKDGPMKILDREKDDVLRVRRSANLDQLIHEIQQARPKDFFEYMMEAPLSDYLASQDGTDRVTLSTVHRSKGLEWPHVMIAGFSEGLMPFEPGRLQGRTPSKQAQSDDDDDGGRPEEERCLAYVAATRAMDSLHLYHANRYHFPGSDPVCLDLSPYAHEMQIELSPSVLAAIEESQSTDHDPVDVFAGIAAG
ncbi:ATP-dependent helicase [Marinobacter subterrani]|uniref:ATP-dependent helicase n=1 Tax=Marinobacter subterrani TaxID=1658765 RepID=UPI0023538ECA|nr:ATP-dependent helicase [Marinobacter subterrani]